MITNIKLDGEVKTFIVGVTVRPIKSNEGKFLQFIKASHIYSHFNELKNQLLTKKAFKSYCDNDNQDIFKEKPIKRRKLH